MRQASVIHSCLYRAADLVSAICWINEFEWKMDDGGWEKRLRIEFLCSKCLLLGCWLLVQPTIMGVVPLIHSKDNCLLSRLKHLLVIAMCLLYKQTTL